MKVRVWDIDGGKMSAGFDIDLLMLNEIEIEFPETGESLPLKDFLFFRKEFSEFMRFTGQKDVEENEIYENDKIDAPGHCGIETVIYGLPFNAAFCVGNILLGVIDSTDIKVIGHSYQTIPV